MIPVRVPLLCVSDDGFCPPGLHFPELEFPHLLRLVLRPTVEQGRCSDEQGFSVSVAIIVVLNRSPCRCPPQASMRVAICQPSMSGISIPSVPPSRGLFPVKRTVRASMAAHGKPSGTWVDPSQYSGSLHQSSSSSAIRWWSSLSAVYLAILFLSLASCLNMACGRLSSVVFRSLLGKTGLSLPCCLCSRVGVRSGCFSGLFQIGVFFVELAG